MSNRRRFLQKLSASFLASGVFIGNSSAALQKSVIDHSLSEVDFWKEIRTGFPLTHERIYMNNGTFGPAPFQVSQAMNDCLEEINRSGEYGHFDKERAMLASFLGVETDELSLTHNTTEGINIMVWGLPLQKGDEVILTTHEHVGNGLPWLNRSKLDGIVLRTFEPQDTQEKNLEEIKKLINAKTKVIAVPHVTCTTGLVFPIKEIAELAKSKGIYTAIDGAHGAGTFDLNITELGCDFYAGCFHKWMLGPAGTGFLYVKKELLDELQAIQVGGYSDAGWDITTQPPILKGYNPTAHRYDYGTQSRALYVGVAAAAKFHLEIGKDKVESRIRELNDYVYGGLQAMGSKIQILTPSEKSARIAMISFKSDLLDYKKLGVGLANEGFRIRQVSESGVNAIRVSTHIYNSKAEIDDLIKAIEKQMG
jgi:selenocysteine lyase/cysteine desulfurase